MSRPQNQLPPQLYYNEQQAKLYSNSTRIQNIQTQLAERALQLLDLPSLPGTLLLDIGCGSGLSGQVITEAGFQWIGLDISSSMLDLAQQMNCEGDTLLCDIGQGFKFRPGCFDGAISISAIQWLCVASKRTYNPFKRLLTFFQSLYNSLKAQGRAVLQFYPDGSQQLQMITTAALKCGFSGGLVTDNPNSTKAKKYFLVIEAGGRRDLTIVPVKGKEQNEVQQGQQVNYDKKKKRKRAGKKIQSGRDWVVQKRQRHKRKGRTIRPDSKYAGRKRKNFSV